MRYILAAVSLVISLVLLGLGIGQRTIWAPPDTIVAQLEQPTDAQLLVMTGETMNRHDGRQTVTITGDGPVTAVVGRDHDVLGWVGETEHAIARLDDADALVLDEVAGDEEPVPPITGSDLWIEEHEDEGRLRFPIDLPAGFSLVIQGEPGQAAPADVRVEWPFDAKTPLFGPLITAGLVFLALALLLFLLALRRHRRSRGPQRRSHRELSRAERRALVRDARAGLPLPERTVAPSAAPSDEQASIESTDASTPAGDDASGAEAPGADAPGADAPGADAPDPDAPRGDAARRDRDAGAAERRAHPARRRLGLVALPALAAIALTGCGPQYWPSPEPSETTSTPTPTSLEQALPQVALTENQFGAVLEDTRQVVAEADAQRDIELAEQRVAGPALQARRANYEVRGGDEEIPPLQGIPDGEVQLLLPQQTEAWPRTALAVIAWQDEAQAQAALVFEQPEARSPYRLVYQTTLASGVQVPAVASPSIGAASLPADTPLLQRPASQITDAYADVILRGEESEFDAWFQEEGDALREQVGKAWKDEQRARPEFELANLEWFARADDQAPIMLVTNDGGALLATSYEETQRTTPDEEGAEVEAQAGPAILAGVEESAVGIEQTYQMQLLFSVPPADAPEGERIRVVGYAQSLVDAREVEE